MASIVVNGNTYTDTGSASGRDLRGTDGYGHTRWLLPMLGDAVADFTAKQSACAQAVADALTHRNNAYSYASAASGSASSAAASASAAASSASAAATAKTAAETAATTATQKAAQASSITGLPLPNQPGKLMRVNAAGTAYELADADPPYIAARSLSATGSLLTTDLADLITLYPPSGGMTLNLPAASTCPDGWWCYLSMSATGGLVTVDPAGSELINGASTIVLQPGEVRLLRSTGTGWWAVLIGAPDQMVVVEGQYASLGVETSASYSGSAWIRRGLNTVLLNSAGASLSGNVLTLKPGTYEIEADVPLRGQSSSTPVFARLLNVGTGLQVASFTTATDINGTAVKVLQVCRCVLTITADTQLAIEQQFPYAVSSPYSVLGYSGFSDGTMARLKAKRIYA